MEQECLLVKFFAKIYGKCKSYTTTIIHVSLCDSHSHDLSDSGLAMHCIDDFLSFELANVSRTQN